MEILSGFKRTLATLLVPVGALVWITQSDARASAEKLTDIKDLYRYTMQKLAANAVASIAYSASFNKLCPPGSSLLLTRGVMKLMRIKTPGGRSVLVPEISSVDKELPSVNLHEKDKGSGIRNVNFGPNAWNIESRCYKYDGNEIDYNKDIGKEQAHKLYPAYHMALFNTLGMYAQTFSEAKKPKNELYIRFIIFVSMLPNPHKDIFNPMSKSIIVFDALKHRTLSGLNKLCAKSSGEFFRHVTIGYHSYSDVRYDGQNRTIEEEPGNYFGPTPACYDSDKLEDVVSIIPQEGSEELGIKPDKQIPITIKRLEENIRNLPP